MRGQKDVKKIVGIRHGNEWVYLEYVFDSEMHGKPFRGAVGASFCPVSIAEEERRMDPENAAEYFEDIWRESVSAGSTTDSLDDWVKEVLAVDGRDALFDCSHYQVGEEIAQLYNERLAAEKGCSVEELGDEAAEFCECIGCGRCFHHGDEWDEVIDQEALDLALAHEDKE